MLFLPIALLLVPLAQSQAQERFTVHSSTRNMANAKQAAQIRLLEKWASPLKMAVTVNEDGNVGIGTNNPIRKLTIGGGIAAASNNAGPVVHLLHSGADANDSLSWLELWGEDSTRRGEAVIAGIDLVLRSGWPAVERIRINPQGNVGIGASSPTQKLHVAGNGLFAGNLTATAFYQNSDRNLKQNISTISNPFAVLDNIKGVRFYWKSNNSPTYGVIAQDVETVMPEAVKTDEKGMKSVDYSQLIAPMLEAIKQLESRVHALEAENRKLRTDNDNIHEKYGVIWSTGAR